MAEIIATNSGNAGNAGSHTINLPDGSDVAGRMILLLWNNDGQGGPASPLLPTGWSQIFLDQIDQMSLWAAYIVLDGEEGYPATGATETVNLNGASQAQAHITYLIIDHDSSTNAPEAGTGLEGDGTAPDPPSLSPSGGAAEYLWLAVVGTDSNPTLSAAPTNYTDLDNEVHDDADDGVGVGVARRLLDAATEDPGAFTPVIENWQANTIAIFPGTEGGEGGDDITLTADPGSLDLTGQDANLEHHRVVTAEAASFDLTGQDATLTVTQVVDATTGTFTLSGQDANLEHHRVVGAEAGAFDLTGQDVDLLQHRVLSAEAGTFSLTGQDAALQVSGDIEMVAEAGTFTLAGQDAALTVHRTLVADATSFDLSGSDADLRRALILDAEPGALPLTGPDAALTAHRLLTAEASAFTFAGQDVDLFRALLLDAETGAFVLTAPDVTFGFEGRLPFAMDVAARQPLALQASARQPLSIAATTRPEA